MQKNRQGDEMFVRLYAYADNDAEAKEVLGDVLW